MGDTGSSVLGLLAAAMTLWADRDGVFPLWTGVLIFSPFIVDSTVTLVRRLVNGERVWIAHKDHFYQRLVQLGWGHRRTVYWEYVLMGGCALSAVTAVELSPDAQAFLLWGWALAYTMLIGIVYRLEAIKGTPSRR